MNKFPNSYLFKVIHKLNLFTLYWVIFTFKVNLCKYYWVIVKFKLNQFTSYCVMAINLSGVISLVDFIDIHNSKFLYNIRLIYWILFILILLLIIYLK